MLTRNQVRETVSSMVNLRPIVRTLPADLETPVSVYLKLAGRGPSFLLESVTGGEQLGRYSFIGIDPSSAYSLGWSNVRHHNLESGNVSNIPVDGADPLDILRTEFSRYQYAPIPTLPRLPGGFVGYLGYEVTRYFEPSVKLDSHSELPEAIFLLANTIVAFDHAYGRLLLITNVRSEGDDDRERETANARLDELEAQLRRPIPVETNHHPSQVSRTLGANLSRTQFTDAVRRAKEHIAAGDIFQVVLSQRLERETSAQPFSIYRALRRLNPSPYMFFLDFSGVTSGAPLRLIGASPEMHVRLEGGQATLRPIAGTRPRGANPDDDQRLEAELLADQKERAEHIMLVDLARNDLGRVCSYGSVQVSEMMAVERYSHVMHIVSQVRGRLRPEYDAFDLLRVTFPAGTVSGAPKIRAMQIIEALENTPRGPYAGAVGYFAYDGSMDTCITIRTLLMSGQTVSVQAGAGIVADSDPDREYEETLNKARALAVAVEMAEIDGD
ncbi:MAG TPA: anthranilate synthase component I [Anaerolineales bacterium]